MSEVNTLKNQKLQEESQKLREENKDLTDEKKGLLKGYTRLLRLGKRRDEELCYHKEHVIRGIKHCVLGVGKWGCLVPTSHFQHHAIGHALVYSEGEVAPAGVDQRV